jgi:hypothetical protein
MTPRVASALLVLMALAAACSPSQPETQGVSADDEAMAARIGEYFERNGSSASWYESIDSIRVDGGVITVETDLELDGADRQARREICSLIHGSDEADFTPGHTIDGADGVSVPCPARQRV